MKSGGVVFNPTAVRKRGMNNKDRHQPTKKARGAKAKENKIIKENKAKASIILTTTDTLMKGGTLLPAPIDLGTTRTTRHNDTQPTTKDDGPAPTRAQTQRERAKAAGEVGLKEIFPAITMVLAPIFIKTPLTLTIPTIHLLIPSGPTPRPITGWTRTTWGLWSCTTKTINRQIQHLHLANSTIFLNDHMTAQPYDSTGY